MVRVPCQALWTMRPFRDRLRDAAKHAGIEYSPQAIADSLELKHRQTVHRWMDKYRPSPPMIEKIAKRWGVSVRWLATEEGPMVLEDLQLEPDETRAIKALRQSGRDWRAFVLSLAEVEPAEQNAFLAIMRRPRGKELFIEEGPKGREEVSEASKKVQKK